jgi:hypothetical protein
MDVYLLDSLNRRTAVIDKYESIIWTERFSAWGDFEWRLPSTYNNRSQLKAGVRFVINQSNYVMTIETTEDTVDDEGRKVLILRGRSLEKVLGDRMAFGVLDDLDTTPKWTITDQPADIARKLFHDICVTGILNAGDIIAGVTEARMPLIPADTIAEPSDTVTYEIDPIVLYKAIKDICDYYAMGFRLVRHPITSALYWDIYMGSNRTTQQTALPAVVFSPGLDNLSNTTELNSVILYKNVAYVLSPVGYEVVYGLDVDPAVAGFERNVLVVVASDIDDPVGASAKMIRRGLEELAKARKVAAFDGELNRNSQYVYRTHYNLGDLVEFQSEDGATSIMQVTEQIFVSDKEGDRSYPTLVVNSFVVEGAWDTAPPDMAWDDAPPLDTWDDGL